MRGSSFHYFQKFMLLVLLFIVFVPGEVYGLPQAQTCIYMPGNGLVNPSFEEGTVNWSWFTNGTGTFTATTPGYHCERAARVNITTVGSNIQLFQSGISLKANTNYRLTFAAYSTTGRDLSVLVHKHSSPYTNYGLSSYVPDLTTGWQEFTVEFTTTGFTGTVNDGRLRFWFAGRATAGSTYWIDNVRLVEVSAGTGTATSTPTATPTNSPTGTATSTPTSTPTNTPSGPHYSDCSFNTGNNASVAVTTGVTLVNGPVLAAGDEIAIFTPDGAICTGKVNWMGSNAAITVWGDDSQTPVRDGLTPGEVMQFRIWDRSAGIEYIAGSAECTIGASDCAFQIDGIYQVTQLIFPAGRESSIWYDLIAFLERITK